MAKWTDNISRKTSDRSFIKANGEQILEVVEQVVKNAISKGHHIRNIQVLAPMYKGPAGIDGLNRMIQKMVNPPGPDRKEVVIWGCRLSNRRQSASARQSA